MAAVAQDTHVDTRRPVNTIWGLTRISIGLVFLWAFFDKLFALGFATGRAEDGTIRSINDLRRR